MSSISAVGIGRTEHNYVQLSLHSQSQVLREKVKAARSAGTVPSDAIQRIESHLSAISQEKNPVGQWNLYELAYESYIPIASHCDLLGVFLHLRTRLHRLDQHSRETWSKEQLTRIEAHIRAEHANSAVRAEIVALARSIHECGLRRKRELEAKSGTIREAFYLNTFLAVLAILLVIRLDLVRVETGAKWVMALTVLFGVLGSLLSATLKAKRRDSTDDDVKNDRAKLLFSGTLGAVAALVVALILRLRIVDFPLLHSSTSEGIVAPAAFYLFGFFGGVAVQALFRSSKKQDKAASAEKSERDVKDLRETDADHDRPLLSIM
jgi:hypothetical protein